MQSGMTATVAALPTADCATMLRRFLEAYWLRPENALWMTLRSQALADVRLEPPTCDVCCGDGVFIFLHLGGVFDPGFDVFASVGGLDRVRRDHADMFDCAADGFEAVISRVPSHSIEVGMDHKPSLLAKADRLDCYDHLIEHDANRAFPSEDAAFETVYCNAAYWVREIDGFLRELRRVTRPGGTIVLQVKLDAMRRYTLEPYRAVLGDRFLDIIDRGRAATWPTLADRSTWERRFEAAGLSIRSATPFVTRTHAHLWDIGLRPIAPLLVKMTRAISPETRAEIKREWVDLFCELLTPLCRPDLDLMPESSHLAADEPAEIQYVLTSPGG